MTSTEALAGLRSVVISAWILARETRSLRRFLMRHLRACLQEEIPGESFDGPRTRRHPDSARPLSRCG